MDILNVGQEYKTIGIGQAIVLEVTTVAGQNNHYIKIYHPDLGNTNFIPYLQTAGLYRVPKPGDNVYVFCKESFSEFPIAWGVQFTSDQIMELIGNRKDEITVLYSAGPQHNSVWHRIELNDLSGEGVTLKTHGGNIIELKDTADISITHKSGSKVVVNDSQILLEIKGTKVVLTAAGIELISAKGAKLILTDGIKLEASQGSKIAVDSTVKVTAADSLGTIDGVVIKIHKHQSNLVLPTSPPLP